MLQRKTELPRGILHIAPGEPFVGLERFVPHVSLQPFIEHYWAVTWTNQPRVVRETIPHPSMHLVFEPGKTTLNGVQPKRFQRVIEGSGRVLGVKFRPGGFRAFTNKSVAVFTGKSLPGTTHWGPVLLEVESQAIGHAEASDAFEPIDQFLQEQHPQPSDDLKLITELVQAMASDRSITRADMLLDGASIGMRQLQRLFREYVGVSPKWVIQRYRLIEAAESIRERRGSVDFAKLAINLGYSDQSHLIRDFKSMVGQTPNEYEKSLPAR